MVHQYTHYIVRLLIGPLLIIAASLTCIIWLTRALRFIDFIVNRGLSVGDFLYITALLVPSLLLLLLPIALLITVIFVYNRLISDSELVVLKAAGLNRIQLIKPALMVATAVMLVCYLIALYVSPLANRKFNDMRSFIRDNYASVLLQEEVFNNPVDGLTVFIRERDNKSNLRGILVHDNREADAAITMMAEHGQLRSTEQGPQFYMRNGLRQEYKNGRVSWLNFDEYTLDINFYTNLGYNRPRDPDEEFIDALLDQKAASAAGLSASDINERLAEAHNRLSWPLYSLATTALALSILLGGQFNRRGQTRRIIIAAIASGSAIMLSVVLSNRISDIPFMVPVVYAIPLLLLIASLAPMLKKQHKRCPAEQSHSTGAA